MVLASVVSMFTNGDSAAKSNDRRSVPGVAMLLGDTAIGWKFSTKTCVTTAVCEAEHVASCDASKEALLVEFVLVFYSQN